MATNYGPDSNNKIIFGREATPGTPETTGLTTWRGPFAYPDDARTRTQSDERVGNFTVTEREYDTAYLARLTLPPAELTFEQFPHLLEMGIGTVSPTGTGPYVYTYTTPVDGSINALKYYTVQAGNTTVTQDIGEMSYVFAEEFELSGKYGEVWRAGGTLVGRTLTPKTAFATATTPTSVEEALFSKALLYVDDDDGTIGTTQITGVLMGATLRYKTGRQPIPVGDGNLYYADVKGVQPSGTLTITAELEQTDANVSFVAAERLNKNNKVTRLIRLSCDGSGTSGMVLDIPVRWTRFGSYTDDNGNISVDMEGDIRYSSAAALWFEAAITNSLSALPG